MAVYPFISRIIWKLGFNQELRLGLFDLDTFYSKASIEIFVRSAEKLEAPGGFEPPVEILQTSALPLGDGAPI